MKTHLTLHNAGAGFNKYYFNMNTQQESSCIYGANRELVIDQTIASTD